MNEVPLALVAPALVALVALLHLWFLVLEMLLWTRPPGLRTFRLTREFAQATRTLAANQGLYNGFLAAGLLIGLALGIGPDEPGRVLCFFSLGCVIVAGVFGALTVSRRILWIQALPAIVALAAVLLLG